MTTFRRGTDGQRLLFLRSNYVAGALFAADKDTFYFIGLPQYDGSSGVFVGTTGFSFTARVHSFSAPLHGCFYAIFKEADVSDIFPFPVGKAFTSTDISNVVPGLAVGTKYRVARIPVVLPLPFGLSTIRTGNVDEEAVEWLEELDTVEHVPLLWREALGLFDKTQQQVLADPQHATTLQPYLPLGGSPVLASTSPFLSATSVNSDGAVQALSHLITPLEGRLARLRQASQPQQNFGGIPGMIRTSGDDGMSLGSHHPTTPAVAKKSASEADRYAAKMLLFLASTAQDSAGAGKSLVSGVLVSGVSNALAQSAKTRNSMFGNLFTSQLDLHKADMNKVIAAVKFDCSDANLLLGYLSTLHVLDSRHLSSLEAIAKAKNGFHPSFLLPDDRAMTLLRQKIVTKANTNESLVGEEKSNMSRVNTTLLVMTSVQSLQDIRHFGANLICLFRTMKEYDATQPSAPGAPEVHVWVFRLTELLYQAEATNWEQKASEKDITTLAYWLVDRYSKIVGSVLRITSDEIAIDLALRKKFAAISTDVYWGQAAVEFNQTVLTLQQVFADSMEVPLCSFYRESRAHKLAKKAEEAELIARIQLNTPTKRPRLDNSEEKLDTPATIPMRDLAGSGDKLGLDGDVVYSGKGIMPLPTLPGNVEICGADIRLTKRCKRPNCKFLHGGIASLTAEQLEIFKQHVASTPDLEWNEKRVKPDKLA